MQLWMALCVLPVFTTLSSRAQTLTPSLRIDTEHDQRVFRIGERISLHLTFFDAEGQPYLVDHEPCGARYCGVFRKPEEFEVQPATGWSDPLATYFAGNFIIMTGSGHPPQPPTKPLQVRLDLNEWVRFDEPGDYTVRITSRRVADAFVAGAIDLHIVPASPEWQDAKLQWIRTTRTPDSPERFGAQEDLRYLATPAAVEEMVSRLRDEHGPGNVMGSCPMCMGIIGLPEVMRKIAAASMNRQIEEPDFPISPMFFGTMTFLRGGSACHGGELRPVCPYDAVLWLKVDSALPKKKGEARGETLKTLDQVGSYMSDIRVKERMRLLPKPASSISD